MRIVGQSALIQEILQLVASVAPTGAPVLLIGESGTGKELLARAIARESARRDQPFQAVHCAALPDDLLEEELARQLAAAEGGTLFLDEVGDFTARLQVRLLRALQERDVRVVAATRCDLRAAVREGRFREDLFYRIGVFCIRVPPLRARPEDIAPLVCHFLSRHGGDDARVDEEALALLRRHAWPGNVRELENVIQRAVVLARGRLVDARMMRQAMRLTGPLASGADFAEGTSPGLRPADVPFAEARARALDQFVRAYLEDALARSGGRLTGAARLAGLDASNFRRLLRRHNVQRRG